LVAFLALAIFGSHAYYQHPLQSQNGQMAQLVVEFDWVRDPKGYRLVDDRYSARVVRNGKGHAPKDFEHCRPLSATDSAFRIFANIATTPAGVLEFVQQFGPLTHDGWAANKGDDVRLVISNAEHMRQLLRYFSGTEKRPHLATSRFQATQAISLDAQVIWDPVTMVPRWDLRTKCLLDALWLQLGQALTSGGRISQCQHCGSWFEAGRKTGRRLDAKFCCDEHRTAFNSLKRSKVK
jgi:hypothetical protein